jgi:ATP-dependent Clp protease, protease subunit
MGYLSRQRIIYIGDRITDAVATNVCAQLLALEVADPEAEIHMYINSGGGIPYSVYAITDTMKVVKCPIRTIALGACMSTSMLVLAAGTKGLRYAMPNARLMVHQPQGGAEGTSHEVVIQAREMNRNMRVIQAMLHDYSGLPLDEVEEATDRDTFMSANKAVEMGLIDGVIE